MVLTPKVTTPNQGPVEEPKPATPAIVIESNWIYCLDKVYVANNNAATKDQSMFKKYCTTDAIAKITPAITECITKATMAGKTKNTDVDQLRAVNGCDTPRSLVPFALLDWPGRMLNESNDFNNSSDGYDLSNFSDLDFDENERSGNELRELAGTIIPCTPCSFFMAGCLKCRDRVTCTAWI